MKIFSLFIKLITTALFINILIRMPIKNYFTSLILTTPPEIILVLGGDIAREHAGAKIANILNLPLVVSGGSNPEHANWLIKNSGLPNSQVKLDYRAKDTLTNFTSLIDDFSKQKISHAFIITSEDHINRATIVGNIIAGSRGIKLSTISIPCKNFCEKESLEKKLFDSIRAIAWVATGKDLKEFKATNFFKKMNNKYLLFE